MRKLTEQPVAHDSSSFDIRQESGHSLLETIVALLLLITVLVPLTLFVADRRPSFRNARYAEAIAYGRNTMERALATGDTKALSHVSLVADVDTVRWNDLPALEVSVHTKSTQTAIVVLRAVIPSSQ